MTITAGKVVSLEYELRDPKGELLDASEGSPMEYLHGSQQIVPGLEREIDGLKVGDERDVVVKPEDGFGAIDPAGVFAVPRSDFPADAVLQPGTTFLGEDEDGTAFPIRVVEVRDDVAIVDANHPLAGETLHYHVKVVGVRDATDEEKAHGHAHGEGHHH